MTISKETLTTQLREYTAQEAGSDASPGLALDWVCPRPLHVVTPVSWGQPPGVRVWFGWGRGRSTKDGWSEAPTEVGELWRHKARGRRGSGPNGWAGYPLPVHAGALSRREGAERKGRVHESGNGCWSSRGGQATLAENQSVP